ncbi:MAG TPA: phosphatase PAP2 family protein [Sphingomicrobium sp.]|nr:phosphatase PAP2 family protein [Sphingomicrobium sp.]
MAEAEAELVDRLDPDSRSPAAKAVTIVGKLGDQPEMRMLGGAILAAGLVSRRRPLAAAGVRMLVAHEIATFLKSAAKSRIDRVRPRSARSEGERRIRPGRSQAKEKTSFPSGHSAGTFAVARALAREYPAARPAALAAAGAVSAAQVPRIAHYPSDVAAGAIIGIAAEAMSHLLWEAARRIVRPSARRRASRLRA